MMRCIEEDINRNSFLCFSLFFIEKNNLRNIRNLIVLDSFYIILSKYTNLCFLCCSALQRLNVIWLFSPFTVSKMNQKMGSMWIRTPPSHKYGKFRAVLKTFLFRKVLRITKSFQEEYLN